VAPSAKSVHDILYMKITKLKQINRYADEYNRKFKVDKNKRLKKIVKSKQICDIIKKGKKVDEYA